MAIKIHSDRCVGLDFGTTNSVLASVNFENRTINTPVRPISRRVGLNISEARELLPSCVFFPQGRDGRCGTPIVGDFAKQQSIPFPTRVAKSVKMQLDKQRFPNLDENIPEDFKTPVSITSQIIKHIIQDAGRAWHENITDAVITIPANFGPIHSQTVLQAAELAGLEVRDERGRLDDSILLSEPEAVMYYVLNEIDAGRSDLNIDLSTEKYVLIYDIGGGTTDITIHRVKRDEENPKLIDMDDIATNRFSGIAGDAFDALVAKKMFQRCIEQYNREDSAISRMLLARRSEMLHSMKNYAEQLKLSISTAMMEGNFFELEDGIECGGNLPINYPYTDYFTLDEYKEIVNSLLAPDLTLNEYKNIKRISERDNIIYPVLDVIHKATALKGNKEIFKPDVVFLSGGMSSFQVVSDRISELFGDVPVFTCNNPNTAVAQGAAVYHYYQHKESELLKKIHAKKAITQTPDTLPETIEKEEIIPDDDSGFIRTKSVALNDTIYLGLANGAVITLAEAGESLPYKNTVERLNITEGTRNALLPIKQDDFDDANRPIHKTVALGTLSFNQNVYGQITLEYEIKRSKIITITAIAGNSRAYATITPDQQTSFKPLRLTADGVEVNVANEIANLKRLCENLNSQKSSSKKAKNIKKIEQAVTTAGKASNKAEYAKILDWLHDAKTNYEWNACTQIARVTANSWKEEEIREYTKLLASKIRAYINMPQMHSNFPILPLVVALSKHGSEAQLKILDNEIFRNVAKFEYFGAACRAYSKLGIHTDWLWDVLSQNNEKSGYAAAALGKIRHDFADVQMPVGDAQIITAMLDIVKQRDPATFKLALKGIALYCDQSIGFDRPIDHNLIVPVNDFLAVCLRNKIQYDEPTYKLIELTSKILLGLPISDKDQNYLFAV